MTKLSADYNLAKLYPEVAEEWHPTKNGDLQPKDCYPKGSQKVWWECKQCGHEWPAFISHLNTSKNDYIHHFLCVHFY